MSDWTAKAVLSSSRYLLFFVYEIRNHTWGISYGFTPILSYIISAVLMKLVSIFTVSGNVLLFAARFVSVCFSTITIIFCSKIAKKLFEGAIQLLFVIMIGLLPQFIFISAYVNTDALALCSIAWIIYAILECEEKKWSVYSCVFLGIGIGVCLQSYYNAYGIIIVAIIYALSSVMNDSHIERKGIFIFSRIIWVAGCAFVISGWWFIRNAILYNGDILALGASSECGEQYALADFKPSMRSTPSKSGVSLKYMLFDMYWIRDSWQSFIGRFDNMTLFINVYCFKVISFILLGGLVCSFIPKKEIKQKLYLKICMWIMGVITIGISLYYSYFNDFQPQGRYCLPLLISFAMLSAMGWDKLLQYTKAKNIVIYILICIYILMSYDCIFNILMPAYI